MSTATNLQGINNPDGIEDSDFVKHILDKNINLLIGSGASRSYIPTLSTNIKRNLSDKNNLSFEDLLSDPDIKLQINIINFLYFSYYFDVVEKAFCIENTISSDTAYSNTLIQYQNLLQSLIHLINRKSGNENKRVNIFSTNYDLFIEKAANNIQNKEKFILNDGTFGLIDRFLNVSNFHSSTYHQGTNDYYKNEIPTINFIKLHGSVSWQKCTDGRIKVPYDSLDETIKNISTLSLFKEFIGTDYDYEIHCLKEKWQQINTKENILQDLKEITLSCNEILCLNDFMSEYKSLSIVSPTKEKFNETVLQQHYYQTLRLLSYELEREQTVLICFAFSFNDEHIREILLRSISNPTLSIYIVKHSKTDSFPSEIQSQIISKRIKVIEAKDISMSITLDKFTAIFSSKKI